MDPTTSITLYAAARDRISTAVRDLAPADLQRMSTYELFRALFGRRSAAQISSWAWSTPEHAAVWSVELPRLPQTPGPLTD